LASFKNVIKLDASGTKVSNTGAIAGLTNVELLNLARSGLDAVSDIAWVDQLARLKYIDLSENKIPAMGPEFTGKEEDFRVSTIHGGVDAVSDLKRSVQSWKSAIPGKFTLPELPSAAPVEEPPRALYPPSFEDVIQMQMPDLVKAGVVATIPKNGKMMCMKNEPSTIEKLPERLLDATGSACFMTKLANPGYTCDVIGDEPRRIEEPFNTVIVDTTGEKRCSDVSITGMDPNAPPAQDDPFLTVDKIASDVPCEKWQGVDDLDRPFSLLRCILPPIQPVIAATASARHGSRRY
jgi:hypothetical protein